MYRHAPLIVSCAGCGVEQPLPRMTLGPRGGHQCWKCEVRAQIDAHGTRPENAVVPALRPRLRPRLRGLHATLALSLVLFFGTIGLAWLGFVAFALHYMPRG